MKINEKCKKVSCDKKKKEEEENETNDAEIADDADDIDYADKKESKEYLCLLLLLLLLLEVGKYALNHLLHPNKSVTNSIFCRFGGKTKHLIAVIWILIKTN